MTHMMNATAYEFSLDTEELKRDNWRSMRPQLPEMLIRCYEAWKVHGPGSTKDIAAHSGIPLLTLRPRTTQLYKLGYVRLVGRLNRDGIYRASS